MCKLFINADPELQETLRHLRMTARFAEEGPAMRAAFEQLQQYEDRPAGPDVFAAVRALRARLDGADFTLSLSGGRLTTSFVDAAGQSFGGLAPEAETDLA